MTVALRFSTGTCLVLTAAAGASEAAVPLAALAGVGAAAGWTARHPFDHVWNRGVRHVLGGPPVPPTPRRRRHAFKVAAVWLAGTAALRAEGHATAAAASVGTLVVLCALQTVTYLCVPSVVLAGWERVRGGAPVTAGARC